MNENGVGFTCFKTLANFFIIKIRYSRILKLTYIWIKGNDTNGIVGQSNSQETRSLFT